LGARSATHPLLAGSCYDVGVLAKLPGWVIDNATSVRAEVAEWARLTAAERWRLARLCTEDAMWATRASGNAERILDHVDPLPASSVAALARLRRQAGWGRGSR
jgi:hypothetical protein